MAAKSKYERGRPAVLFALQARSLKATNDTPGLDIRHFCDAVTATSISHSSNDTGAPPSELTQSNITKSSRRRAPRARIRTSFNTPVEVSLCTSSSALALG